MMQVSSSSMRSRLKVQQHYWKKLSNNDVTSVTVFDGQYHNKQDAICQHHPCSSRQQIRATLLQEGRGASLINHGFPISDCFLNLLVVIVKYTVVTSLQQKLLIETKNPSILQLAKPDPHRLQNWGSHSTDWLLTWLHVNFESKSKWLQLYSF